jgi:hypothetical protein
MMNRAFSKWSLATALLLQASHVTCDSIEFGFYTNVAETAAAALVSLFVLVIPFRVLY